MRNPLFGMLLLVSALGLHAALPKATPDADLAGLVDAIVVGTITTVTTVPNAPVAQAGEATLRITRTLKGPTMLSLPFRYPGGPDAPLTEESLALAPQQQALFFLRRCQAGYCLLETRPAGEADAFQAVLRTLPLEVTLQPPAGVLPFGQQQDITVRVKNRSEILMAFYPEQLEGFFYSPRLTDPARVTLVPQVVKKNPAPIIAPGEEQSFTYTLLVRQPAAFALLTPDTYLQTPLALRIVGKYGPVDRDVAMTDNHIASPWIRTMTGFPPPEAK